MGLLPCPVGSCSLVKSCSWAAAPGGVQRVLCPLPALLAPPGLVGREGFVWALMPISARIGKAVKVTQAGSLWKYR